MLKGAKNMLSKHCIDYLFISTHSMELHTKCKEELSQYNYKILADADLEETYSWDGVLVFKSPEVSFSRSINISKKI